MKKAVPLILLTLCACNCFSQQAWFRFNNLSEKEGLADANIASVIKDHRGYMWFASSEGLNCFNGNTSKVYHHLNADSNSLSDDNVNIIFEDSRNNIWIGTRNGLNLYDTLNDTFIHFFHKENNETSISSNEIWSVAEDNNQELWIGTMGGGLNKLVRVKPTPESPDRYSFLSFTPDAAQNNSLSSNIIWSIAFDKNGYGWLGTENGLNRFTVADADDDKISFASYLKTTSANSLTDNSIWKVYADDENNIWLLSFYGMLDCLLPSDIHTEPAATSFVHVLPLLNEKLHDKNFVILSLLKDADKGFWAGTDKQGLLHYTVKFNGVAHTATVDFAEHFLHDEKDNESLVNNAVYTLYEDKSGILWIGTANGVSKYINQKTLFNVLAFNNNELIRNSAISVASAANENTWFSTADNKIWLFNTVLKEPKLFAGLDNFFEVTSLCITQRGDLFAGTSGTGIYTASKEQVEQFITNNKPVVLQPFAAATFKKASIFTITEHGTNQLLVAGFGRLGIIDMVSATFTNLIEKNSNAGNLIFRCAVKQGNTFFIGADNGLYTLAKNKLELLQPKNGKLNSDRIISLYADENDVWIGTISGLNIYNPATGSLTSYSAANGLPDNTIKSIIADKEGNIWIATRNGLCRYSRNDRRFSIFNEAESVNTNQLTSLAFNGTYLFIGSDKGINTIIPSGLNKLNNQCNIAITGFKIAGNSVFTYPVPESGKNIKQQLPVYIKWNENNISIAFTALDYKNPGAVQYAYILEGFDKDWVYNGKESSANYTNLPGGDYTFKVKYAGSNGVWMQSAIALPINVSTAWFKSWWFYALCTAAVIALFYTYYRIRLKRILELQKMRNKIARDLHDDIGSTLSTINILSGTASKKIKTDTEKTTEMLQKIGDSSRRMMDAMGDIVWSINPDNDALENMAVRMKEYAAQVLEAKDIDYKINIDDDVMNIKLPLDKRRDFYLVFKEAVNNLAKYAQAAKAEVNLSAEGNILKLTVKDDGMGFDTAKASTGNGLKNMKQRAENIGGKLSLSSKPQNGTTIELILPIT